MQYSKTIDLLHLYNIQILCYIKHYIIMVWRTLFYLDSKANGTLKEYTENDTKI